MIRIENAIKYNESMLLVTYIATVLRDINISDVIRFMIIGVKCFNSLKMGFTLYAAMMKK
jgi:hypothetical protein